MQLQAKHGAGKAIFLLLFAASAMQSAFAAIPCPITLLDGSAGQSGIALTFRNSGKLPIQQLELGCAPLRNQVARAATCHVESGLFYPGNTYDVSFAYSGKISPAIFLTLKTARLSDGELFQARRTPSCAPLKIATKKERPPQP